jgi:phosphate transport system substrate-binding protein
VKTLTSRRVARLSGAALVGSLALSACGSDNNSTTAGSGSSGSGASSSAGGASSSANTACAKGTLSGEGSTAQQNAIEEVISQFQDACAGATVNYNPTGSGAGIKQFNAGQVDFAGSDSALKTEMKDGVVEQAAADKQCGSPAWNLPMVTGPIAVAYKLNGVDKLILTPDVIAKIFTGQITTWNDPAIAKVNPGVTLPSAAIKVFFRSDESGTTENFTKYLKGAAPKVWTADPAKKWTGKGEGKEKTAGVAGAVKATEGGITYAEWSAAKDNNLSMAQVDNGAGPVTLTGESAGKAVAAAKQVGTGNNIKLSLDYTTKTAGTYPIVLVTYEIVCSKGKDPAKAKLLQSFLKQFSSPEQQKALETIGYAPLPAEVATKVTSAIDALS